MAPADSSPENVQPVARTFATHAEAREAIRALEAGGMDPDAISVVSRSPAEAESLERDTGASEELEHATQHHHPLADFVEWLGRVESAIVPGFGSVLGTGNLWQDVATAGHSRGAITGALVGRGFAVDEAAYLESQVFEGQILVVYERADEGSVAESVRDGDPVIDSHS